MKKVLIEDRYYWCKLHEEGNWVPCLAVHELGNDFLTLRWSNQDYGDFFYFDYNVFYKVGEIVEEPKEIT